MHPVIQYSHSHLLKTIFPYFHSISTDRLPRNFRVKFVCFFVVFFSAEFFSQFFFFWSQKIWINSHKSSNTCVDGKIQLLSSHCSLWIGVRARDYHTIHVDIVRTSNIDWRFSWSVSLCCASTPYTLTRSHTIAVLPKGKRRMQWEWPKQQNLMRCFGFWARDRCLVVYSVFDGSE